jgi:hypothetical protein
MTKESTGMNPHLKNMIGLISIVEPKNQYLQMHLDHEGIPFRLIVLSMQTTQEIELQGILKRES